MIDSRALISPQAKLAPDVVVGPFAVIGPGVEIGPGCTVGAHAMIERDTRLGARNHVHQFASLGSAPQDKSYKGEPTRLEIGDDNVFREFCTVNRGTSKDQGVTRIGSGNLFMSYSHVAHDCVVGDKVVLANLATLGGHVQVGDWVIMAGFSGVHQFCRIGAHAFIANNAAVTRDVPPYVMAVGQPAVPHSVNSEGLKRRGFSPVQIRNIRNAFRTLYREDRKLEDAVGALRAVAREQPEIAAFVTFIDAATRSLVR
ncbi:MAG TPA: acyl-ACP--UDP-N-acetylglucosamine O-acyltransferase [Steroidobacteraceae bacterium]|nr:acyl-ACP--UDP-N-acetylglucosamine O-acyltransferase [Steroidobacteraceae bacterium]HNS28710.1 acyl-ACP--UDP-N-acetylglucosamine O-acyltransferase [Steroidobacteraceae bacterium]